MTIRPSAVLDSLAQHMAALSVATYSETFPKAPAHPVATFGLLPDAPDLAVAINHYNTDPDYFNVASNPLMFIQLRWRAAGEDPLAVLDLSDEGFRALHTYSPALWAGGVSVLWMLRTISAPPERDENQRWTKADSYEIRLDPGE